MNDSIELAGLAGKHFKKRFHEEFGNDAYIYEITVIDNVINAKLSIPNEWEPMTKDILRKITNEVYEIINQGLS